MIRLELWETTDPVQMHEYHDRVFDVFAQVDLVGA